MSSSSEDQLRDRLRSAGAADEDIKVALSEFRKQERTRIRVLRARGKSLKDQNKWLREQLDRGIRHDNAALTSVGSAIDQLAHARDEVAEMQAELKSAVEIMSSHADDGKNIADALMAMQVTVKYILWILGIGMAIVTPAMILVLVLTVWRFLAP